MPVTLVCIHGRGFKPPESSLAAVWEAALARAFARFDAPGAAACPVEFVYYGDVLTDYLMQRQPGNRFDPVLDIADRWQALHELERIKRKRFASRSDYERLPGRRAWPEFLADLGVGIVRGLHLADPVYERLVPDMVRYQRDQEWGAPMRGRLLDCLEAVIGRGDQVVLVSHCLGAVIGFDVLWQLSHAAPDWYRGEKILGWLTLGSPLGDETVKARLAGSHEPPARRFPNNLVRWANVKAEDDWISHDNTVADDYAFMLEQRMISRIEDFTILNHTVRYGRHNPHSSIGYLYHPRSVALIEALVTD